MWIVRLALRRPYTFVVMALAILLLGVVAIVRMPADVFPDIDIPVVSAIWTYTGVSPDEMAEVITIRSERGFTTGVNDIEHMESQSLAGLAVIKLFFHPERQSGSGGGAGDGAVAIASGRAADRRFIRPTVIRYNAASVPILQLGISSDTLSEGQQLRSRLQFSPHAARQHAGRQFPAALRRQAAADHGGYQPAGAVCARAFGRRCFERAEQSEPDSAHRQRENRHARISRGAEQQPAAFPKQFNNLPVKTVNGTTIYLRDVAQVRDGAAVQTEHRSSRRTARRAADGAQERRRFPPSTS